jgi:hypothetical protein
VAELAGQRRIGFEAYFHTVTFVGLFGEEVAAVETLRRHAEDVERRVGAPNLVAKYYVCRLQALLAAAEKIEERRGAYVAEAKGVMERATRSLRGLQSEDWDNIVSASACFSRLDWLSVWLTLDLPLCVCSFVRDVINLSRMGFACIFALR